MPRPNNPHNVHDATGRSFASQQWELDAELTHLRRRAVLRLIRALRWLSSVGPLP